MGNKKQKSINFAQRESRHAMHVAQHGSNQKKGDSSRPSCL